VYAQQYAVIDYALQHGTCDAQLAGQLYKPDDLWTR